ncbi:MAG: pyruvate dehydrogenase complex E1 component subunit beta [Armatimonadetes bacterium]|nr:pyruvate dehydrogenase complex E1 component subunit beta [Armatimonadota bacterium]
MPKMGDAMEEGTLVSWRKQDGESVQAGEVIAEIETDKSNVEVEAEDSGVLRIQAQPGTVVPVGQAIATIGDAEAKASPPAPNAGGAGEDKAAASPPPPDLGAGGRPASSGNGASPNPEPQVGQQGTAVYSPEGAQAKADTNELKHIVQVAAHTHSHEEADAGATESIPYREAIRRALEEELDRDENVFLLGEEIGQYQGTFKITQGFLQKYGPERIVDTPISEAGMVGMTTGAAMLGMRPVIEFMTLNFALVAWDQIINHTAKILYMSGGQYPIPCVLRGPGGVGGQLSAQHSQDLAHWYANTPGLKVVAPATPADAKGLLKAAIRDNNPVVYTEHARLYATRGDVPTSKDYLVPIGVADIKREGKDVSIISYSYGTMLSLGAAEKLAEQGIDAEVVDLRSLQPIDLETVFNSVRKTHRAVVVQEQWPFYGLAAEFVTQISTATFDELDAPVERVTGAFVPMPYARALEDMAVPHENDIIAAVKKTLARSI